MALDVQVQTARSHRLTIAFTALLVLLGAAVSWLIARSITRPLAQRSAAAAKDIKGLIAASVADVEAGTRLVDAAGRTMSDVVDSIRRVADIMGEITAASQEQGAGIEQVNHAIAQMDQVTQQNAALVEEAAAAAASMQDQAEHLRGAVAVFRTGQVAAAETVAPVAAPRRAVAVQAPARPALKTPARRKEPALAEEGWETF